MAIKCHIRFNTAQHSVHLTGGSLRVFKHFRRLEVGTGKIALSRPTHQQVTRAVSLPEVTDASYGDHLRSLQIQCRAIQYRP